MRDMWGLPLAVPLHAAVKAAVDHTERFRAEASNLFGGSGCPGGVLGRSEEVRRVRI
jgi:hypothetical protein